MKTRRLVAIVALLALAALAFPGPALDVRAGLFDSPPPVPPPNDDFDNATVIYGLPYSDALDTSDATWADDDPGDCSSNGSVWYAFTPAEDMVIEANTFGSSYDTTLAAYTGSRGALTLVPGACNDDYNGLQSRVTFQATAGMTYYFLVGFCCGNGGDGGGYLEFRVQEIEGPANDDFVDAISISGLPYGQYLDTSLASVEPGEPTPSCVGWETWGKSVWYAYTPAQSGSVTARTDDWLSTVAAYTGDSLNSLTEAGSACWGGQFAFAAEANRTYYFQIGGLNDYGGVFTFYLDVAPPPVADFWFYPSDPSMFDTVSFHSYLWDPGGMGIESCEWDFGDGAASVDCWSATHLFTADGDYTVRLEVITYDGRSASTSQVVQVRTRDVAITKFLAPSAAKAGQTRSITVGVNSKRYPERVRVELWKSVPGGSEWVGSLVQSVPVRPASRTTDFGFNYTFTADDAQVGKVTFRAVAYLESGRDAFPADNEAIAPPTKVTQ